ncbi:MAG TPA: dolichyl-phosphate beta-glucosyltransferase [Thermoanaerobaculia bacterium]|nr:dolichyl-phosphate beta-glucosyltransferase [Thermoanaerobaculia bacterium]
MTEPLRKPGAPVALSVVIPAYNEEERLGPSLERAIAYLSARQASDGETFEILVADDGSSDRTVEVAERFAGQGVRAIRLPRNRGKGAAVKAGLLASGGERVLVSDADFSTPIEEIEKLEAHLGQAEVAIGSRAIRGADVRERQPFYRVLLGKAGNKVIRLFAVRGIADTQCGFKLFEGRAARALAADLTIEGFAYDVELLWLAKKRGLRIAEVGVIWVNSAASKVDPLRAAFSALRDVVLMRLRRRPGSKDSRGEV